MERLTEQLIKKEDGYYMVCSGSECTGLHCEDCPELDKIIDTRGAYEDTGFSPEEIKSAFTPDASIKLAAQALGTTPERLRELAAADKDGRVVVLPCKVGDIVWANLDGMRHTRKCAIEFANIGSHGTTIVFSAVDGLREQYGVNPSSFGKTVFLTREEAEKALEAMKDG